MITVTIDEVLRSRLAGLKTQVALLDAAGQVVGYYLPAADVHSRDQCPYSQEELARFQAESGGRPLRDIWKDLHIVETQPAVRLPRYRDILRRVLAEYASGRPSHGQIEVQLTIDSERDHYLVVHVGWDRGHRVHGVVIHVDIIDGKIWIQYDGTDRPVAEELVAAGIPREDIVLAFHPAELRQHTGYGVG